MVDRAAVKEILENEQRRLETELADVRKSAPPAESRREGSPFGKREEEAADAIEREQRLTLESSIEEQLAKVDTAMKKLAAGTYGICDVCRKPISAERLEALPAARFCVKCKSEQDRALHGKVRKQA